MEANIPSLSRRSVLLGGVLGSAVAALDLIPTPLWLPERAEAAATPSDIQFDIGAFLATPTTVNGVSVQFAGPAFTTFLTATLQRKPTISDQSELNRVLTAIEKAYPWGPAGIFTFVSYGLPYFNRLSQAVVRTRVPSNVNSTRSVLQEAVASPTDVVSGNGITKVRYQVPVKIEKNDLLFMFRSDSTAHISDVISFFNGSNRLNGAPVTSPAFGRLLTFTGSRNMFGAVGTPRQIADSNNLPFAPFVHPQSPMWMGFADQQVNASATDAKIVTFAGNAASKLTTARSGDYFDTGAVQHFSHDILDLLQWFDMDTPTSPPDDDGVFTERVQYMFHSPAIDPGNADQFTDGGGPAVLPNEFRGTGYAAKTAAGIGTEDNEHRIGHLSCLQRSSRTSSGSPIHIRMDGPGFDNLDVPDGSQQPKLQFTVFVPHSDFFRDMRVNQASLDLVNANQIPTEDNGLERFITATRRQNFLCPPRRHRSFPLIELGG